MLSNPYINEKYLDIAPDSFENESLKVGISSNAVISRTPDGKIKSRYVDSVWDFTAYSSTPTKFTFKNHGKHVIFPIGTRPDLVDRLTHEMKRIVLLLIFSPEIRNLKGRGIRTKIQSFKPIIALLRKLTKAAASLDISLEDTAGHSQFYASLCSSTLNLPSNKIGYVMSLIRQLRGLNESGYKGVPSLISGENYEDFFKLVGGVSKRKKIATEDRTERTPLIPSRILSNLIIGSMEHLKTISPYLDGLIGFFQEYHDNPHFWCIYSKDFNRRNKSPDLRWNRNKAIHPLDALAKYGLSEFVALFPISNGHAGYNVASLSAHLTTAQSVARLLCHAYSGMRQHEIQVLPFDTLEKLPIKGLGNVPFFRSYTSKIGQENYSKPTYWVTSQEVEFVVSIAQKIAEISAIRFGINCSRGADFPLFPSLSANMSSGENHVHYEIPLPNVSNPLAVISSVINDIQITEDDLKELEIFDMFRDWRSEKEFTLGNIWPTAPHHFRRSLAVYSARSGIVSLPSLSTHYKHMTLAMTALYAENSAFAVNMIDENEGEAHREQRLLVEEFMLNQRINQAIGFDQNVLKTSSRLTGGMGNLIQRLKDKENLPTWLFDRTEREKRVQDGRLHYRETTVGGCMNPNPCERAGFGGVSVCDGCEFSILGGDNGEKGQAYKESLELSIEYMDCNTPAYKAIKADIERIELKQLNA